jgi:hypothetical protein
MDLTSQIYVADYMAKNAEQRIPLGFPRVFSPEDVRTLSGNMLRLYSEYTIRPAGVPDAGYPAKQTMPPAQFKAYCDRVNQKR